MDDHQKNLSKRSASPSKNALLIKLRRYGHGSAQDLITSLEEDGLLYNQNKHNLQRPGKENRICKICKKGFSSGRALGGHMRVHAQARGQEQLQQQTQLHLHLHLQEGDNDPTTNHILPIPNTNYNTPIVPKLKLISKPHHHHRHGNYKRAGVVNSAAAAAGGPLNVKPNVDPWISTTKTNISSSNPICSLCGKKFPSMKSLFGHMRCHPEREWRGIQPPPPPPSPPPSPPPLVAAPKNTSVSSSSTVSDEDSCGGHDLDHNQYDDQRGKIEIEVDDHQLDSSLSTTARSAVNLAESLSSWSVTAKRGRKAIAAVPPPRASASASEETEPIPETDAAYHLMMLAHGNPLGECFPSRSYSNSNSKQQPQASVPCFRRRNGIGNPQNLGDLAKKQRGGDDGSQFQSQSGGSRNREYLSFPKKLKIDVASSLTLTSPCSRRDEEQLETSRIVRYDDSIHSKCLKLKADKGHSPFAPNFDFDPVVEQMNMYRTSTTFTWDSYAGGGLEQGSRRQSSREEEEKEEDGEESDSRTTDDDSSDGDQRDLPDELTCISEMILSHQKLSNEQRGRKKKKKKMKLRDLERMGPNPIKYKKQHKAKITRATASLSDRFKCWTCNKTFTSHQALGGHRSSHKLGGKNSQSSPIPPITTFTTTAGIDDSAIAGDDHPISRREEEELESQTESECVTHRCKICNKAFPTGQALGGHQRLHWTSPAECAAAAAPSSSVASREDIYISKAGDGRGMLEFDLNEMPERSMEEDNEALESVCCTQSPYHASSSYFNNLVPPETRNKPHFYALR